MRSQSSEFGISSHNNFVKPVHQHGGSCINLYCVAMTYGRLRSGHMTHEKGLYVHIK